ncbi:DUF885 domain-containing protein [Hyphomonas sp. FCG-A18]|uniref:DUF885 domain-containing protein n=1 Tax=Hyphomonas sp. FCG-A18 TaxID=3080019 RepID=UPI002B2D2722|nr:DUF885 domain-containing protein [Hyphomonas sp. FCG-A18]
MRLHTAFAALALAGLTACGQPSTSPQADKSETNSPEISQADREAETARLNEWFEVKFNEAVARSPMTATFLGSREGYDKWDDVSMEAQDREMDIQRLNVAEMRQEFDPAKLTDQGALSFRLAEYNLEQAERANKWRSHNYTFNQMFGVQSRIPSFLVAQHKVISKDDAEAYIARLVGIEAYLGQHLTNTRAAAGNGIRPPLFVYDYVLSDARNVLSGEPFSAERIDSPLLADFKGKIDALLISETITEEEHDDLLARAITALNDHVGPAYDGLIAYMEADRESATTDDGAWKLPNGDNYYADRLAQMTTTDMSADEIHDLGLAEVARIHGEMEAIMVEVGFEGTLQDFFEFTRTDEQFFYPNTPEGKERYLNEATDMINIMEEALPAYFKTFPQASLEVKAVEPFREKSAGKAFYQRPAPDGSRPGVYYANLYRMQDMPIYQMEALAYHEGIPGHHMQLAISQELQGLPKFRKFGGVTAYTEGWGLYSEFLPKEMGFYTDPMSDYGRLAMELWRAARLVVDTGLHDKQWTREEAIQYLLDNTPNPEGDCIKAIERYIVMPGQATAYKIGMNKIIELREEAKAELGEAFDIRDFHEIVLKDGPVPLAILEENVKAWTASIKAG